MEGERELLKRNSLMKRGREILFDGWTKRGGVNERNSLMKIGREEEREREMRGNEEVDRVQREVKEERTREREKSL